MVLREDEGLDNGMTVTWSKWRWGGDGRVGPATRRDQLPRAPSARQIRPRSHGRASRNPTRGAPRGAPSQPGRWPVGPGEPRGPARW